MVTEIEPGITHDETAAPMETPAPFLAAIAALAILIIGGLMATEFIYTAQHPVTVAHTPASQAAPVAPPAG